MGRYEPVVFVVAVVVAFSCSLSECKCEIKGIFNFGDSNTDTGGFFAAFPSQTGPFGMTYFKKPVGRATDGRVIVDFLAQAIGIPFLSPYLKSIGSNYKHGANFATLASTVRLPNTSLFVSGLSPFALAIQVNQLKQLQSKALEVSHSSSSYESTQLPSVNTFRKAVYTFYIGQNDFTGNLGDLGVSGVKQYLPEVTSQIASAIKEIYGIGGRTFWVLNLAPIGCYPSFLTDVIHKSLDINSDIDEFGCKISYNNAVRDYNNMLKETLKQTRADLPNASIIYVDTHSVILDLIQHPTSYGLKYGTRACCGQGGGKYNFNPELYCGSTKFINGTPLTTTVCEDPSSYVSWDGIHITDHANKIVTLAILNGSYFDPPFPLHHICDLRSIE